MTEPVELHTVTEAVERLRISERTFFREVSRGRIRVRKLGRRTLVTSRELDAYIASLPRRVA